jgi:hypothetical protein
MNTQLRPDSDFGMGRWTELETHFVPNQMLDQSQAERVGPIFLSVSDTSRVSSLFEGRASEKY